MDLGAGTGILGLLACEVGAGSVVAVDSGDIIELARAIAADNGMSDRITHTRALSTEVQLDRLVDVVVCDQMGGAVHDAGLLAVFADARRRLLAPGGRLVPASFTLYAAPVTFNAGRSAVDFWTSNAESFDLSAGHHLAVNTEWRCHVDPADITALSPGRPLTGFAADHDGPIQGEIDFVAETGGRLDGFTIWFVAQLSPSVTLTNNPWDSTRFDRFCNFYPTEKAVELGPGDEVSFQLDVRPRLGFTGWRISTGSVEMRQSTFNVPGISGPAGPVPLTDDVARAIAVLQLIDGSKTRGEIIAALEDSHGAGSDSGSGVERLVDRVLRSVR